MRRALLGAAVMLAGSHTGRDVVIGALAGPDAVLFAYLATLVAADGITLRVTPSPDLAALGEAVATGARFACAGYTTQSLSESKLPLAAAFYTVTLPMGIYSRKHRALAQLVRGQRIVLPAEPVDYDRARVLLYNYGLLRAHEDDGLDPDFRNIVNPIGFHLETAPRNTIAARLADADAVLLPHATAAAAGLRPDHDSIGLEDGRSPYAGVLAVRSGDLHSPAVRVLSQRFHSRPMRQFIYANFGDSIQPPW